MHCSEPPAHSPRRPRQRWRIAAIIGIIAASGTAADTASAGSPSPMVTGDPQSPRVAALASVTLDAMIEHEQSPTPESDHVVQTALRELATATALELGVAGDSMEQAWQRADRAHQTAVVAALTQLGVEYRSNSSEPFVGFDCSGLTSFAWREAGVQLSRQSGAQISEAAERTEATAVAGDLVQYPGHVMMYLGVDNAVVHASNPERDVELWLLSDRSVSFGDPSGLAPYVEPVNQV